MLAAVSVRKAPRHGGLAISGATRRGGERDERGDHERVFWGTWVRPSSGSSTFVTRSRVTSPAVAEVSHVGVDQPPRRLRKTRTPRTGITRDRGKEDDLAPMAFKRFMEPLSSRSRSHTTSNPRTALRARYVPLCRGRTSHEDILIARLTPTRRKLECSRDRHSRLRPTAPASRATTRSVPHRRYPPKLNIPWRAPRTVRDTVSARQTREEPEPVEDRRPRAFAG